VVANAPYEDLAWIATAEHVIFLSIVTFLWGSKAHCQWALATWKMLRFYDCTISISSKLECRESIGSTLLVAIVNGAVKHLPILCKMSA
jgi:hypothetical protein